MAALLTLAVLVGLDNLQVAAALGLAPIPAGRRLRLAVAFGLCEGLMPLLGLTLGHGLHRASRPLAGGGGGGCWWPAASPSWCSPCASRGRTRADEAAGGATSAACGRAWLRSRCLLYGLPLSLSLDNLLAGVALGTLGYPLLLSAAVVGATSTALCLLGLFATARLARWLPGESGAWSGGFLVLLGLLRAWHGAA